MFGGRAERRLARHGLTAVGVALVALTALLPATAAAKRANPQISGVSVNPATVASGGEFDATAIFVNHHRTATKKRHMLFRIFPAAGGSGSTLASLPVPALKPGSRVEISITLKLNPGKKPGDYDLTACRTPRKNTKRCGPNKASTPLTVVGPQLLAVAPASHDFGTFATGDSSSAQTFTFSNDGEAETGALELSVTGAAAQFTTSNDTCTGAALEPGEECTADVTFAPTTVGAKNAQLVLSGTPGGSAAAQLSGRGTTPAALTISPIGETYGTVATGSSGHLQTFTVTNTGGVDSGPLSTALAGADPGQFLKSGDNCDGATLASGETCTIDATFSPTANGPKTATLEATGTPGGTVAADLAGIGAAPAHLTISPTSKDFGTQATGTTSAPETLTVTNTGGVPTGTLTTTMASLNPDQFSKSNDNCAGSTLAAGATCTVDVAFAPTVVGFKDAALDVKGTPGGTATAGFRGTGAQPASLSISPTSKAFNDTLINSTSSNQTFTVTNDGGVPSGSIAVALSGTDTGQFSIQQDLCTGQSLLPTGNCTITARFSPLSRGDKAASLDATASPGGTASSALTGKGLAPANLTISPSSWDYGNVQNGTVSASKPFIVTNTGDATTGNMDLTIPNNFIPTSNTCDSTLAGGASCQVNIAFQPLTTGPKSATFTAAATPGGTATANLSGNSVATAASLQISLTNAGATAPGTYSGSATITSNNAAPGRQTKLIWIRNNGEADAHISNSPVPFNYNDSRSNLPDATCNVETGDNVQTAITFTNLTIRGNSECYISWFVGGNTGGHSWDASFTITGSPGGSISGFVSGV